MHRQYNNPSNFGPWDGRYMNSQDHEQAPNFCAVSSNNPPDKSANKLSLPKMKGKKIKNSHRTGRRDVQFVSFPLKVNPLQLEVKQEKINRQSMQKLVSTHENNLTNFGLLMASFDPKNAHKITRTRYKLTIDDNKNQQERGQRISEVNLLCKDQPAINIQKKYINRSVQKNRRLGNSAEHQFAKKRSLMQFLRYLKNSSSKPSDKQLTKNPFVYGQKSSREETIYHQVNKFMHQKQRYSAFSSYAPNEKKSENKSFY